jgi:hypothetical protein
MRHGITSVAIGYPASAPRISAAGHDLGAIYGAIYGALLAAHDAVPLGVVTIRAFEHVGCARTDHEVQWHFTAIADDVLPGGAIARERRIKASEVAYARLCAIAGVALR